MNASDKMRAAALIGAARRRKVPLPGGAEHGNPGAGQDSVRPGKTLDERHEVLGAPGEWQGGYTATFQDPLQVRIIRRPLHDQCIGNAALQALPNRFVGEFHEAWVSAQASQNHTAEKYPAKKIPAFVVPSLIVEFAPLVLRIEFE